MTISVKNSNMDNSDTENLRLQSKYDAIVNCDNSDDLDNYQKLSQIPNGLINHSSKMNKLKSSDCHIVDISRGLCNWKAIIFLVLWYFFSFTTLFLNKYILAYRKGDPTVLGIVQMFCCAICGYIQLHFSCGLYKKLPPRKITLQCLLRMALVGSLRFSTVLLGLIALWYVPVSFAETVKSSAPVFTVVISRLILGDKTSLLVISSLFPVMGGLALCSANELSFNTLGFIAAVATNLSECFQNVYSKMLLSGEKVTYSPPELQCFSSLASIGVQIPASIMLVNFPKVWAGLNHEMILILVLGGVSFHCQSLMEYMLLGYISPVTHSVANTTKRALLIWLSVLTFGNKVTFLSGLGTMIVIFGVVFYNKAQELTMRTPTPIVPPFSAGAKGGVHAI
ncbi:solute carrier family 35 member E2A-like [Centruroides vittatus]|uniref:solute carrier family 35 member E2A-like n=1 Tax=Centruroides vittatus TaxID=120091 RepID=UPI0035108CD4